MDDIILSTQNGEPVASSRDVAKRFGKEHNHVLRDIKALEEGVSKNGQTPMFYKTEYTHPQNHQKYPMYLMRSSWPHSTKSSGPCRMPTSRTPSTG